VLSLVLLTYYLHTYTSYVHTYTYLQRVTVRQGIFSDILGDRQTRYLFSYLFDTNTNSQEPRHHWPVNNLDVHEAWHLLCLFVPVYSCAKWDWDWPRSTTTMLVSAIRIHKSRTEAPKWLPIAICSRSTAWLQLKLHQVKYMQNGFLFLIINANANHYQVNYIH
jgi:hypothetical protein